MIEMKWVRYYDRCGRYDSRYNSYDNVYEISEVR